MPIIRTGESEYDKEIERWNAPKRQGGHNADGYEPYPAMRYRAFRNDNAGGKAMCGDISGLYTSDPVKQAAAEAFTKRCQVIVADAESDARHHAAGWRKSPELALELFEQEQRAIAQAAAEEMYRVERMGEQARKEYAAHDAATEAPATEVPEPKKAAPAKRVAVA